MPAHYITKVVDICGINKGKAEDLWDQAKTIVKNSYVRGEDDSLFYPLVMGTFKKSLGKECLDKLEAEAALAIAKQASVVKAPTAKTFPKGINPDATSIWTDTIKKNAKVIKSQDDPLKKWAAAIVLFKRACRKKGLSPFTGFATKQKLIKAPMLLELSSKIDPALRTLTRIEKLLSDKKVLTKAQPKKFALDKIKKDGKAKLLSAVKTWKFYKGVSPATVLVTLLIPKFGFKKVKGNTYSVKAGTHATIRLHYGKKSDNTARLFLDLKVPGKTWDNLKKEQSKPEAHLKGWIRRGFMVQSAQEVPEDISVEKIYPVDNKEDAIKLLNILMFPEIVNLGDVDFQLTLVDYLLSTAKKFGVTPSQDLNKFKNDSEFRESTIKDYTFRPLSTKEDEGEPLYSVDAPVVEDKVLEEITI